MRFVLDQGLPRGAVAFLRSAGHEVEHVADIGMAHATDFEILERARSLSAIVVTLDADFHALIATSAQRSPSAVRLRLEGLNAEALVSVLLTVIASLGQELEAGSLVTVDDRSIRFRLLPINK